MRFGPLLFALLLPVLASCGLRFDSQEITIVHDATADRIDVHIVSRGIYASQTSKRRDPLEEAAASLAKGRRTGTIRLFDAMFGIDLTEANAMTAPIAAHVDVESGALFTDGQGVLCEQQFVRIRDAREFARRVNIALQNAIVQRAGEPIDDGPERRLDEVSRENLLEFFRSGGRMLLIEPGRIELRAPLSNADHRWLKGKILEGLAEALATKEVSDAGSDLAAMRKALANAKVLRFLQDNEFSLVRDMNLTRLAIGVKGATNLVITTPPEGRYDPALLGHLREDGTTIEDRLADDELQRRFAEFRMRDAVLPPDLARMRAAEPGEPAENK